MTLPRPLAGIRIVDFTWVRAGPWANRWLGAFGAEVLKIEWPLNMDSLRGNRHSIPPGVEPGPNSAGFFADTNANKLSVTLNTRSDKGKELIRKLISKSDVVMENFSSTVMHRWGLHYEGLKEIKEDIIYVSMAGLGHTGRNHSYGTMGPSAQALSGLTFLSGLPGAPPAGWGWSYMDDTGGMYGAICTLTALEHRNKTGKGQHVDLSQMITGITLTGAAFLDKTVNERASKREGYPPGNRAVWPGAPLLNNYRGPIAVPHNAYRTKGGGYNDWCAIVCGSDEEWERLVGLMGNPVWAANGKFSSLQGRLDCQEELDAQVEQWTLTLEKYELAAKCQTHGVTAMPVQSNGDRVDNDPQLRSHGYINEIPHAVIGTGKYQNAPFKMSKSDVTVHTTAPLIGEHTRQVAEEVLGMTPDEVREGFEDGTFWPLEMEKQPYIEASLT